MVTRAMAEWAAIFGNRVPKANFVDRIVAALLPFSRRYLTTLAECSDCKLLLLRELKVSAVTGSTGAARQNHRFLRALT